MQFERLRKSHKKEIIIGAIAICVIGGAITFATSRAFYRVDDSIDLAKGTINYKAYDFKIMAMYKSEDKTNYTEIEEMPSEGYTINESKSYCNMSNGSKDTTAILKTIDGNHIISKLKKNDKCFIYFDKKLTASEIILSNLGTSIKTSKPNFSSSATTDEEVYSTNDGMYGETTYYWRGAATTNYLKFANFCWRIVRINGDGSIRLIYDGTTCHANGTSTTNNIAIGSQAYYVNNNSYKSEHVGYTFSEGSQRGTNVSSNLKQQNEIWYNNNLNDYDLKIADGKYCNDRNVGSGGSTTVWNSSVGTNKDFKYAAYSRVKNGSPSFSCSASDIYILKIGAITADEVVYAGGSVSNNESYYLFNGQDFWTMSPFSWEYHNSTNYSTNVYEVYRTGNLEAHDINNVNNNWMYIGIRPVINLRSDIIFSSGNGTQSNPYVVAD